MNRRHFLATTVAGFSVTMPVTAFALSGDVAQSFVRQVVDEVLKLIRSPAGEAAKRAEFMGIMNRYADMRAIAGFALGRYARTMPASMKGRYVTAFEKFVAATYVSRFSDYSGETINVGSARASNSGYVVDTTLVRSAQPPISVLWDISDRSGRTLIADFEIEGLSMAQSQRGEFTSLIDSYGGDLEKFVQYLESRG